MFDTQKVDANTCNLFNCTEISMANDIKCK